MFNPAWTDEENTRVFGLCANPNWHGHNYELEVTVCGEPDPQTGYVLDLHKLSVLLEEHVLKKIDHKNLNLDVDFMRGIIPSSENFTIALWQQIAPLVAPATLYQLRLYETPRNYVEYCGPQTV
jgi:6-pyruvoyltetrahydropterin/6-carboxytetrahydropterin synthase